MIKYHSLFVGTVVGFIGSAALVLSSTLPAIRASARTRFFGTAHARCPRFLAHTGTSCLALVIWFVLGAATALMLTPSARLLRRSSDEVNRPAVFAAQFSLSHACFIVTYPLAGVLDALLGLAPTALVLAAIGAVAMVTAFRAWTSAPPTRVIESPAMTA